MKPRKNRRNRWKLALERIIWENWGKNFFSKKKFFWCIPPTAKYSQNRGFSGSERSIIFGGQKMSKMTFSKMAQKWCSRVNFVICNGFVGYFWPKTPGKWVKMASNSRIWLKMGKISGSTQGTCKYPESRKSRFWASQSSVVQPPLELKFYLDTFLWGSSPHRKDGPDSTLYRWEPGLSKS